ncbi:MAG TPA: Na+/H+ antiporter NhaA [Ktedonobacteraceae bacterium]|nr:Na+/H+ antiporter NhaA [Ktedonobacteraceae bacterium]
MVDLLLQDEASSGKFLLAAAVVALILTNSPWAKGFEHIWGLHFSISFASIDISEDFRTWINEGLMAIFFLVVGLEIKREVIRGELSTLRAASLSIAAAIGGMVVPSLLFAVFNAGHGGEHGWGVPMTTDTAFAVGILALLGDRIPPALKIFLLSAAVVDDVGALTVIAAFYTDHISVVPLLVAAGLLATMLLLQWLRLLRLSIFVVLGVTMWFAIHASGVHASIAGAIMGLAAPIVSRSRNLTKRAIAVRLERALIPTSTFIVIPLFALANAGVSLTWSAFHTQDAVRVGLGVAAGLVIGKLVGIFLACWLMVKARLSDLPEGVNWHHIAGVGSIAGIGFTLSIFIAELAFDSPAYIVAAKMGIFAASIVSALLGLWYLRMTGKTEPGQEG